MTIYYQTFMPIKTNNIEEIIIKAIANEPQKTTNLIEKIQKLRPNTSKQAVYACLRKLTQEKLILTSQQTVSFNLKHIDQMIRFYSDIKHNYTQANYEGNFIYLNDGERIVYYFKNSLQTDIFWAHAISILVENLKEPSSIFNFNPHNYFILYNQETEADTIEQIIKKGHIFLIAADKHDFLDKHVKKLYQDKRIQYHILDKQFFPTNNHYFNIIGDYIIETFFDKKTSEAIDHFYKNTHDLTADNIKKLQKIISQRGRDKIIISRNKTKANKLKKRLNKYFYTPKEYKI